MSLLGYDPRDAIMVEAVRKGKEIMEKAAAPNPYEKHDPVNSPRHYNKGTIEVADFIADQELNFDRGNAVKYICRAGDKPDAELSQTDKAIQDLKKAIWYLQHEIKWIETHGVPG